MSTNTYVALQTQVLSSSASSITFSSIPQTYTDLVLVMNGTTDNPTDPVIQFNGDSASHYSSTTLGGNGSSASSGRYTSRANMVVDYQSSWRSTPIAIYELNIMNYSNTTTYKTVLSRANNAGYGTDAVVGLWAQTSAITSITILTGSSNNFNAGSTFTLYGIANADVGAYATGGIITQDANYYYHAFGNSGYFTPTRNLTADILVVAGGGGGGATQAGGGGAGGVLAFAAQSLTSGTGYSCTVGSGGAGASTSARASSGTNSQFASLTASVGGGGGGSYNGTNVTSIIDGGSGGSGGGGGSSANSPFIGYGGGTTGGGYAGGNGNTDNATFRSGGGGGGAGGAGGNYSSTGGAGGLGTTTVTNFSNLSTALTATGLGVNGYLASGGAGGGNTRGVATNGGGSGGDGTYMPQNGVASTGSGGGGGGYSSSNTGGSGGSGLIIVRYSK